MATRNRREFREDPPQEKIITLDTALDMDRASALYEKLSEIVKTHGVDLFLKVRLISSDYRTAGFLGDITSQDEVTNFIENPEGYLKAHFGEGSYRIDIIDGISKKFLTHLKIDISSPREGAHNKQPDFNLIGEVSRAYKEGINLGKSSQGNSSQPPFDMVKLFELLLTQQEQSRTREEKILEKIRLEENRLREKEMTLLEKTLLNNSEVSKQFQPMIDFMSQSGKVLSSAMSMIERSATFLHNVTPEATERPFFERLIIEPGTKLLTSNPQLFERLLPMSPPMNIPQVTTPPIKANINPPFENKTPKEEITPKPEENKFNFEAAFPLMLLNQIERATMDIEPEFCAECLLTDIEVASKKGLISIPQLEQVHFLLASDHLEAFIKNFYPDITKMKGWLLDFQKSIRESLTETQEKLPEDTRQ